MLFAHWMYICAIFCDVLGGSRTVSDSIFGGRNLYKLHSQEFSRKSAAGLRDDDEPIQAFDDSEAVDNHVGACLVQETAARTTASKKDDALGPTEHSV
jgi:hypothetical protein